MGTDDNSTHIEVSTPAIPSRIGIVGHALLATAHIFFFLYDARSFDLSVFLTVTTISYGSSILPALISWAWINSPLHTFKTKILRLLIASLVGTLASSILFTLASRPASLSPSYLGDLLVEIFGFFIFSTQFPAVALLSPIIIAIAFNLNAKSHRVLKYFSLAQRSPPIDEITEIFDQSGYLLRRIPNLSAQRIAAIEGLRRRGRRLRQINTMLLCFVVIFLAGAAVFVVYAGQIAGKDTQSLDTLLNVRKSVDEQELLVAKLEDELTELVETTKTIPLRKQSATSDTMRSDLEGSMARAEAKMPKISERLSRARDELKRRTAFYAKLEEQTTATVSRNTDEKASINLLIAAGITRFGVLAISIYLVQILIGLYRYNAQVAAHYLAQMDALLLSDQLPTNFAELASLLKLSVAFGKPEASLPEKAIDKISDIIRSAAERIPRP